MQNKIKRKIKIISFIFISFIVIFCNCTPVLADYFNNNEKANLKEKQLLEKIKIIHQVFPNQTDEAALLATLSHRGELTSYITNSYEPNFDKKDYKEYMTSFKETADTIKNTEDGKYSQVNGDNTDILLAATIIMLDSSSWVGKYSDENYKKALAGNKLIGNMAGENDLVANGFNAIFCGVGAAVDTAATPIQFGADFLQGHGDTAIQNKVSRYVTMTNVCTQGYIGGTYSSVRTLEDDERKQAIKDKYAEEIIKLAKEFRGEDDNSCIDNPTNSSVVWKQAGQEWSNLSLGSSNQTVASSGCLITSLAMLMARSGTQISNSSGKNSSFNPGTLVTTLNENDGFSGADFKWTGHQSIAQNWNMGTSVPFSTEDSSELAAKISEELSQPAEGQYQKFILLQIYYNSGNNQHWVAVDSVNNNEVIISDPGGPNGNTLDANYDDWRVNSYRVMYATDVPFGQTGKSVLNNGDTNYCTGSGEIIIPEEFGGGSFTITEIDRQSWCCDSKQVYNLWVSSGAKYQDGIAVIDGRYLIACTSKFGAVGDKIDFFLDDGTRIPTIKMDAKAETPVPWDPTPANEWGHDNGASVLEFEVSSAYWNSLGRPGGPGNLPNWKPEWHDPTKKKIKRVASATNLGPAL